MTRPKLKTILALCCGLITAAAHAADIGQTFPSIDAWLKSYPGKPGILANSQTTANYGDLTGNGRRDWAGAVLFHDAEIGAARQIAVLVQNADGSYTLAAQGPVESTDGGTGHYALEEVSVNKGSIYTSWDWNWHGCGGGVVHQIKFDQNQWRVIGAEVRQAAAVLVNDVYDDGDSGKLSNNLLTGKAVIHFKPLKGKPQLIVLKREPSVVLLDDKFDESAGTVDAFAKYGGC